MTVGESGYRAGVVPSGLPLDAANEREASTIDELAARASACRACTLYERATQVVFGDGPVDAELMLMGEQPGDQEDVRGEPFVGPAGHVLDRALTAANIDRGAVFVTNAVKHFKWEGAGKVRLHKKPNATEIRACRPWWEAELALVRPRVLCCLGATAAQAVFGSAFRVTRDRGQFHELSGGVQGLATIHPSAVLRADRAQRDATFEGLVSDLRLVASHLEG